MKSEIRLSSALIIINHVIFFQEEQKRSLTADKNFMLSLSTGLQQQYFDYHILVSFRHSLSFSHEEIYHSSRSWLCFNPETSGHLRLGKKNLFYCSIFNSVQFPIMFNYSMLNFQIGSIFNYTRFNYFWCSKSGVQPVTSTNVEISKKEKCCKLW